MVGTMMAGSGPYTNININHTVRFATPAYQHIENPTPIETLYKFFDNYFQDNGSDFANEVFREFHIFTILCNYLGFIDSPSVEQLTTTYNKTRKFIIDNDIKDLKTINDETLALFKLLVLV